MSIRVAFPLLGRGTWTGGYIYLKNTLQLIRSQLSHEIEASVFLSPEENAKYGAELSPLVDGRIIVDPAIGMSGRGKSLARAIATGTDGALQRILTAAGTEVAFENASFYGARFAIPVVSWIPDFQHRHMPEMFTRANWWRRDLGFRAQIAAKRTIMLSSATARSDMERFYGSAKGSHVVRFAIQLDVAPYLKRDDEMRATYGLPERFCYLPNQFWRHKNHGVVIDALALLKTQGRLGDVLPIALTGQAKDVRNPGYFEDLMQRAKQSGVESHFRYLGLVPYEHVLSLNASCEAMINPSRFEGWSTPIEEAKAFATPLALSDIPIHREQAPDSLFFDPGSAEKLAANLLIVAQRPLLQRQSAAALAAAQQQRLAKHAAALLGTVKAALATRVSHQLEKIA